MALIVPDPDPSAAEGSAGRPADLVTGGRIREFRELRGYSARKLAMACGLSPSFISQLENGQTNASVRSLLRICGALTISLSDLFSDRGQDQRRVVRRDDRSVLQAGPGAKKFRLTGAPIRHLEVYQIELEPGAETGPPETYGDTQALLLVTKGTATFQLGDIEEILGESDSIEFQTSIPHSIRNYGECPLVAVITLKAIIPVPPSVS